MGIAAMRDRRRLGCTRTRVGRNATDGTSPCLITPRELLRSQCDVRCEDQNLVWELDVWVFTAVTNVTVGNVCLLGLSL